MKKLLVIIAVIASVIMLGIAGTYDYNEEVIQTLYYEQYRKIVDDLGGKAPDKKIVDHYMENRAKYDSIK